MGQELAVESDKNVNFPFKYISGMEAGCCNFIIPIPTRMQTFTTDNTSDKIIKAMLDDLDFKLKAILGGIEKHKSRVASEDSKDEKPHSKGIRRAPLSSGNSWQRI